MCLIVDPMSRLIDKLHRRVRSSKMETKVRLEAIKETHGPHKAEQIPKILRPQFEEGQLILYNNQPKEYPMKSLIKMSILPLFICLSLNGKALANLSCNELNYKDYIWSFEKTQKLISETGKGCNLRGANLTEADLIGADLSGAYLTRANLTRAKLRDANLSGADLIRADLTEADLIRADLIGADLMEANFTRADLRDANLSGADLIGADLTGAYLSGAYLSGADLSGANLTEADLIGADLYKADLIRADLTGTDLSGADLREAIYDDKTMFPEGFDPVESGMKKAPEGDSGDN